MYKSILGSLIFICFGMNTLALEKVDIQVCERVSADDDWRLTFDYSSKKVEFFDNNSVVTGTFKYTIETVEGIDVYVSDDKSDMWEAKFYGSRTALVGKAVLELPSGDIDFICHPVRD